MAADRPPARARDYTVAPYRPALGGGVVRALNAAFPNGWGTDAQWR